MGEVGASPTLSRNGNAQPAKPDYPPAASWLWLTFVERGSERKRQTLRPFCPPRAGFRVLSRCAVPLAPFLRHDERQLVHLFLLKGEYPT
jgi:hypothetical protein